MSKHNADTDKLVQRLRADLSAQEAPAALMGVLEERVNAVEQELRKHAAEHSATTKSELATTKSELAGLHGRLDSVTDRV